MTTTFRLAVVIALLSFVPPLARAQAADDAKKPDAAAPKLDQAALEKEFAETMSGATLVGSFTVSGAPEKKLTEEKYTISNCKKLENGLWNFETRIQYGGHDVTLPLALQVKWAGDTPVITLTDLPVPGLGTFTARVLVFRNEYAGTWSGGDHGGHLFGRIVKKGEPLDPKPVAKDEKKAAK
ncbi:MAG TPA: hypothetical protein VGJ26_13610 [Pirellulales bacterium]|jgi:hypothetical protein